MIRFRKQNGNRWHATLIMMKKAVRFNGTSALATAPERVKKWKCPEGGYLHAMHKHDWGDFHYRITGKNEKGELQLEGG